MLPDPPHQGPGVDPVQGGDAGAPEEGEEVAPLPLGHLPRRLPGEAPGHEALDPGAVGLRRPVAHPVVADVGLGHDHDLAPVGGVCEDLLVARHGGVEDHFTEAGSWGSGPALEEGAVFEE